MKKGFSMAELAIVIVVVGLLMGMGIKGKSLIDAARVKNDMAKIQKMRAAASTYISKYNVMPAGTTPQAMIDVLVKEGLINDNDVILKATAPVLIYMKPVRCLGGLKGSINLSVPDNKLSAGLCLAFTPIKAELNNMLVSASTPEAAICTIETISDDSDVNNGSGRGAAGKKGPDLSSWDCKKMSADKIYPNAWVYKLFL